MGVSRDVQEKIQQLQMLEQNIHHLFLQKQQLQAQQLEFESAVRELENARTSYKIVGNVMVSSSPDALKKELAEKLERVKLRIGSLEKQEQRIKEKVKLLQDEVMKKMD